MTRADDNKKKIKHLEQVKAWVESLTADEKKECDFYGPQHFFNPKTGVLEFCSTKPCFVVGCTVKSGKTFVQKIKMSAVTREILVEACQKVAEAASKETV